MYTTDGYSFKTMVNSLHTCIENCIKSTKNNKKAPLKNSYPLWYVHFSWTLNYSWRCLKSTQGQYLRLIIHPFACFITSNPLEI